MTNVTWENFSSKASLYGLSINQYWQNTFTPDTGAVALSNLVFKNFTGHSPETIMPLLLANPRS